MNFILLFYCTLHNDLKVPLFDVIAILKPVLFWEDDYQNLEWLFIKNEVFKMEKVV